MNFRFNYLILLGSPYLSIVNADDVPQIVPETSIRYVSGFVD